MRMRLRVRLLPVSLGLAAAAASGGTVLLAQQQPIFGCHASPSCATPPIGPSALTDPAASGLLQGASIRWGHGFHFGLVAPVLARQRSAEPVVDAKVFHLRGVSLLPTPGPTTTPPTPTPTVTPSPPAVPAPTSGPRGATSPRPFSPAGPEYAESGTSSSGREREPLGRAVAAAWPSTPEGTTGGSRTVHRAGRRSRSR